MNRLLAGLGLFAFAAFLAWMHGRAQYHAGQLDERDKWRVEQRIAADRQHGRELELVRQQGRALAAYAERLAERAPIVLRSHDTVREYANTPAGAVRCLGADRVLGIDALDGALFTFTPAAARGGAGAVPADAGASAN